jgi:hypothetical protein
MDKGFLTTDKPNITQKGEKNAPVKAKVCVTSYYPMATVSYRK